MSGTKEIKNRLKSVRETQKITNAMYLIASAKMRKAKEELDRTRPFFNAMGGEIKRIFRTVETVEHRYFYPPSGEHDLPGAYGYLVITADKGLAGAYNQNVIKAAMRLMSEHEDTKLFVVGEYGRQYFMRHHIPIEQSFLYTAQNPTMQRAREIAGRLLELYDKGELVKIFVVYTDMQSALGAKECSFRLLPFHRAQFTAGVGTDNTPTAPIEMIPSVGALLDSIVPSYVAGYIYSVLVDSFCSEQQARMAAMDSANRNAENLIRELTAKYNHVRQSAITQEITEISAGAKQQRESRLRRQPKGGFDS